MPYELEIAEPIGAGVRRIATELVDDTLRRLESPDRDPHETVHEVRKNCKKVRAVLRLVRPCVPELYKAENRHFRDAAASLSGVRDAEAALESFGALTESFSGALDEGYVASVRDALVLHKEWVSEQAVDLDARMHDFSERMHEARIRVGAWSLPEDNPESESRDHDAGFRMLREGLAKTYSRGRKAMERAWKDPGVENFHDWRKRAKYLRYHLRLLRPVWPRLLKPMRGEVKTLGDLLGDDHDLAVLRETLAAVSAETRDAPAGDVLEALIRQRSMALRVQAYWLGRRIYAEKAGAFCDRIERYWRTARAQHRAGRE